MQSWLKLPTTAFAALLMTTGLAPAQEKLKVGTTMAVIADMAQQVAGDAADLVSVTRPGAEIHGNEPTPQDLVVRWMPIWNCGSRGSSKTWAICPRPR